MSGGAAPGAGGPAPAGTQPVRLVRLDRRTPETALLREAVLRHRLPPGQRGHVGLPVTTLPAADADPARTPFAVTAAGHPVADAAGARAACAGFGVLDRAVHARDLVPDPAHAVLLRAFYLTTAWQGRGVGRAVCSAPLLDRLAADVAPHATELVLCVDEANHAAARVYGAAGFAFTGHRFLDAAGKAQLVMARPLVPKA
ncbi:GCN5 family acetyltransferase [Nocardiopsis sp. TSRI0078]|uniref:GNAT family N-acetyltransferase n=1 Tax=unclassified Nocardiopsis TaxID=2649073 RepID=UPI00093D2E46|nr:GNAT family protein [Nocardiopsis sp. TSRI0078]OKI15945.1 GCN5 family acetyltransferase [Nocardiopsis sp. TSRI0078]